MSTSTPRSSAANRRLAAVLVPVALFCGCGTSETPEISDTSDDLELIAQLEEGTTIGTQMSAADNAGNGSEPAGDFNAVSVASSSAGHKLSLRLSKGDRIPLVKTIDQVLVQKSAQFPATARTHIDLYMTLSAEEVQSEATLLSVHFHRVHYSHDLNGNLADYDSQRDLDSVPYDAVPYAGMVNQGYSFWLGRDNAVQQVVDYDKFLANAMANVPLERRQNLLAEISNRFGNDNLADIIDGAIGFLPFHPDVDRQFAADVMLGDTWTQESRILHPAPTYVSTTCRLTDLQSETATIDIAGRVTSGETVSTNQTMRIVVTGGQSMGRCLVDRRTGLPLESQVTRSMNLVITTADGQQVPQEKTISTLIRTFPEGRGRGRSVDATTGRPPEAHGAVRPAADVRQPPYADGQSSPPGVVRANYPQSGVR